jgi:hypothetical protein
MPLFYFGIYVKYEIKLIIVKVHILVLRFIILYAHYNDCFQWSLPMYVNLIMRL